MSTHPHYLWADLFRNDSSEKANLIQVLRENVLFRTLDHRELRYLSNFVYERIYEPGEPIFHQNDRGFGMYVIAKGKVAITTQSSDGDLLVTTLTAGSFFGELSLVEPTNIRTATATATERTVLIGFFKPDLTEILERRPAMGVKILYQLADVLGRRLVETTEKITLLTQSKGLGKIHEDVI